MARLEEFFHFAVPDTCLRVLVFWFQNESEDDSCEYCEEAQYVKWVRVGECDEEAASDYEYECYDDVLCRANSDEILFRVSFNLLIYN